MKKKILVVAGLLAMSGALTAQSVYPGQHAGKLKRETVAPMKVKSFDLKDVRICPSATTSSPNGPLLPEPASDLPISPSATGYYSNRTYRSQRTKNSPSAFLSLMKYNEVRTMNHENSYY